MTGTDYTLFTHKSVPVIFELPCISRIYLRCLWTCNIEISTGSYILTLLIPYNGFIKERYELYYLDFLDIISEFNL
jgi:hypothetical protein